MFRVAEIIDGDHVKVSTHLGNTGHDASNTPETVYGNFGNRHDMPPGMLGALFQSGEQVTGFASVTLISIICSFYTNVVCPIYEEFILHHSRNKLSINNTFAKMGVRQYG